MSTARALSRQDVIPFRLPPQNLEAEMGVLGGMILDNSMIDEVSGLLKAEDFYRDVHQVLYRAILELRGTGSAVDALLLWEHLGRGRHAADFQDGQILSAIRDATPHAANTSWYASIVHQKAVSRELMAAARQTIEDCEGNQFTAEELVERAEGRVFAIDDVRSTGTTTELAVALGEAEVAMERRAHGEVSGVPSGLLDLDDIIGGFEPGSLTIVAARPSMGKTAFVLNICDHVAVQAGITPLVVSLEMNKVELANRMVQSRSGVDGYRIREAHRQTDADRRAIAEARAELVAHTFPVDDTPSRTVGQIAANARRYKARRGIGLLVVDYLQLINPEDERDSRQEQISKISRRLKAIARELNIPVVALSQLSRKSEGREDKRPMMSDLRDSGAIEQDADVVILLHRPDYYDPNDMPGVAEANVAKNRNGATSVVRLQFTKRLARFDSMSHQTQGSYDPAWDA